MAYLNADDDETKRYVLAVCEAKYVAVDDSDRPHILDPIQWMMNATLLQLMEQMQIALYRNSEQKYITGIIVVNDYVRFIAFTKEHVPELNVADLLDRRLLPLAFVTELVKRKAVVNTEARRIVNAHTLRNGKRSVSYSDEFKKCWSKYIIRPSSDLTKFPK